MIPCIEGAIPRANFSIFREISSQKSALFFAFLKVDITIEFHHYDGIKHVLDSFLKSKQFVNNVNSQSIVYLIDMEQIGLRAGVVLGEGLGSVYRK